MTGDVVVNSVVMLHYLSEETAVFMGDTVEEKEVSSPLFGDTTRTLRFPCLQISREHWELCGRPTVLHLSADSTDVPAVV